jgi:predicted O-methyltransferase YrrM
MTELTTIGLKYGTDKANYHGYTDFYHEHLAPLKVSIQRVLEIGVWNGASLLMWKEYLPHAEVIGIDNWLHHFPKGCITVEGDATKAELYDTHPNLKGKTYDLIIDDGSHKCSHQQASFDILWPRLNSGGVYIMEDIHSSFIPEHCDTPETTYERYLKVKAAFERGETPELAAHFEYWRVPGNTSDSGTIILIKK